MNYGFVIDNRKCIGCHACSTACKSENQVPLGVYRTWVKYTEVGTYPDVTRNFQVTRCNHCANPPCARICPVTAMYQRTDGIVEFDPDVCIGCKACMQACPYDAIYIDPDSGTAAKCHYCAHRVEGGLEPACVVVCPEHAIIAGDMDDPESEISQVLAKNAVTVRKPEQGTAPKLFYIEGNDVAMHPTALPREPAGMMWADVQPLHGHDEGVFEVHLDLHGEGAMLKTREASSGTPIRTPQPQGQPHAGPIQPAPGRMAGQMVQLAYNAQHKVPWHWPVPAYLVTKGVGAGVFLLLSLGVALGLFPVTQGAIVAGGLLGLIGLVATTALLVYDLEKPQRFLSIVFRPQMKSWLARGAFILISFSTVAGVWWALEAAAMVGLVESAMAEAWRTPLAWLTIPLSVGGAIYTAFLFAQAEGRDLWQSPLLPVHLLLQSVLLGGASLALLDLFMPFPDELSTAARVIFAASLVADLFVTLVGEFGVPHASEVAARAAHDITHGRYRRYFWWGAIGLGHLIPLVLLAPGLSFLGALAAVAATVGMYFYEYAFVMAPQDIPNS
ncbi:MAG: polysulfide reductase NrfD [Alphaproteobacteria bacterium]|nr:polysulfide reductase NrfD [Alphaproteobacteria bacterium]MCB9797834.1 polysulfide reductase NrfD [Alphaproteobacteria bacterium]